MVILDDYKARRVAKELGLKMTGTLGVIVKAKIDGIITSIKPYLEKIEETNFRLAKDITREALLKAGE